MNNRNGSTTDGSVATADTPSTDHQADLGLVVRMLDTATDLAILNRKEIEHDEYGRGIFLTEQVFSRLTAIMLVTYQFADHSAQLRGD